MMYTRRVDITDSSNIVRIWYDRDEYTMLVQFSNLSEYRYKYVNPADFGQIISADSVGQTFNSLLRTRQWPTERI